MRNSIRKAKSIKQLKGMLTQFFTLKQISLFSLRNQIGVSLLAKLRLKFSHLNEHKFCHKVRYCVSPLCVTAVLNLKQLNTFFLSCQFLASERQNLHGEPYLILPSIISFDEEPL